jgi:hypothetical protein
VENQQVKISYDREGQIEAAGEPLDSKPRPEIDTPIVFLSVVMVLSFIIAHLDTS